MRSGKQKVGPAKRKTHPLELKLQVLQQLKAGVAVVSFNLEGIHPHDATTWLDQRGICVRAGNHCAQPLMRRLGVAGTVRASVHVYTSRPEIDALVSAVSDIDLR